MTETEFDDLIAAHVRRFDGLRNRLDKPLLEDWFDVLKPFPFGDVEAASRRMFSDEECRPRGYSEHPSRLRQLAVRLAAERNREDAKHSRRTRYTGGELAFDCGHCEDTGLVIIIDSGWVSKFRAGKVERIECSDHRKALAEPYGHAAWVYEPRPAKQGKRCSCVGGNYNPERDAAAVLLHREEYLNDWLQNTYRHPNRTAAFDDWNQGA